MKKFIQIEDTTIVNVNDIRSVVVVPENEDKDEWLLDIKAVNGDMIYQVRGQFDGMICEYNKIAKLLNVKTQPFGKSE